MDDTREHIAKLIKQISQREKDLIRRIRGQVFIWLLVDKIVYILETEDWDLQGGGGCPWFCLEDDSKPYCLN